MRTLWIVATVVAVSMGGGTARAGTLVEKIGAAAERTGVFAIGDSLAALAVDAADFPATSTAPGISFRYNPQVGLFERVQGGLGPVYTERGLTLGRGKFDLGVGYSYTDFKELEGRDLAEAASVRNAAGSFLVDRLNLASHVIAFTGTYGVTDDLDVNLLIPLFVTKLSFRARGPAGASGDDSTHAGIGDIFMRAKYRLAEVAATNIAGVLTLRLPSGEEGDFQGRGRTTVTPSVVASRLLGPVELHGGLGIEADTDPVDASRARYEIGAVVKLLDYLALFGDIVGASYITHRTEDVVFRRSDGSVVLIGGQPVAATLDFPRTDLVDAIGGLKLRIGDHGMAYIAARVPLTEDGLRPDYIPSGGVELTF